MFPDGPETGQKSTTPVENLRDGVPKNVGTPINGGRSDRSTDVNVTRL